MKKSKTAPTQTFRLNSLDALVLENVQATITTYRGKRAVRLVENFTEGADRNAETFAILTDSNFQDGVIEAEFAARLLPNAIPEARGFIGVAFRVQEQGARFECFFVRPLNARANDQLRRNHSTQYVSHPDYPWFRLRDESPGVYESYTDLELGAWTKIKIVVAGVQAQLYINDAEQPCLMVNDLKLGPTQGQIALWIGSGTEGFFTKITVQPTGNG